MKHWLALLAFCCAKLVCAQTLKDNNQAALGFKNPEFWLNPANPVQTTAAGQASLTLDQTNAIVPNFNCNGDENPCGRLRCHWIWGDGQYRFFPETYQIPGLTRSASDETTRSQNYVYGLAGRFPLVISETKAYNDEDEPPVFRANVDVGPSPSGPLPAFAPRISSGEVLFIEQQHRPRNFGYRTGFAVSFPATLFSEATDLVFLYNSQQPGGTGDWAAADIFSHTASDDAIPIYYKGVEITDGSIDQTPIKHLPAATRSAFANGIRYKLTGHYNPAMLTSGFSELRIFPFLKSRNWSAGNYPGRTKFKAVLLGTGTQFNFDGQMSEIIAEKTLETEVVDTHDPNIFWIEKICRTSSGAYQITFGLEFCNTGRFPENRETVEIMGDRANFVLPTLLPTVFGGSASPSNPYVFELSANLNPPLDENGQRYKNQCARIFFTLQTDETGLTKLRNWFDRNKPGGDPTARPPLSGCVTFKNSRQGKMCNDSLFADTAILNYLRASTSIPNCSPGGGGPSWYLIALILMLLAAVVYWWLRRVEH